MIKLGVLFGGRSGEHEISLMSAASVLRVIDPAKFTPVPIGITRAGEWRLTTAGPDQIENDQWEEASEPLLIDSLRTLIDFALPILHGPYGEDGTIQGLLEMLDIPYAGSGVTGSAAAMDKLIAKALFASAGLPQSPYMGFMREDWEAEPERLLSRIETELSYPIFVKPANMGSSVGISKAHDRTALGAAIELAAQFDRRLLVEQGIDCRELEVGVLGNYPAIASGVGEILPSNEFYDYKAKYLDGDRSKIVIPAALTEEESEQIRELAVTAYQLLDCCGFARVDLFQERQTGRLLINEINTIPGFTRFSMFPLLWAEAGIPYPQVIEKIIEAGYDRYNVKNRR
ncbi:MAG TPA: D-alanine--D-alanine ligase [Clostridiales bacterium]|jgi:D-alanine-D-alanine ligase|nr:D-alanine--D-alanine ligase [Clostridiales bacterium]